MGGETSLRGLAGYQQRYVTVRVLADLAARAIGENAAVPHLVEFSIEGQTSDDAPSWDVRFVDSDGKIELHECKDTQISRQDRLVFYDRLRKEVASGTPIERIRPVWVTDPGKQTENALEYIGGIADTVKDLNLSSVTKELPKRVDSISRAIQEAVYRLCHHTGEEPKDGEKKRELPRSCSFDEAKALLQRIGIARHRFDDLDQSVKLLATGLLTKGSAQAIYTFVTGVLTEEIVNKREARFTIDELLAAVGTTAIEVDVEGRVRNLLSFRAASGFSQPIRLVKWIGLPDQPTTKWTLAERVPEYVSGRSCLVVAAMGVGKTVASQMAFADEAGKLHRGRVLRVEARTLEGEDLDALVRLACMLCGVGPTWLAIDGLDEISHVLRTPWERALGELAALPNLTLFVTVRREVLAAREWLGNMAAPLARIEIQRLEPTQVKAAFAGVKLPEPTNVRLVEALQNPFLLSLYANIVTPTDMPLAESGEVPAFLVVDEFWKRRVRGVSEGQRAVGESEHSQEPKRKAALHLSDKSLSGELAISRGSDDPQIDSGLEMLLREGVIRDQGTNAVAWIHEWIREYALIDRLLSRCKSASGIALAQQIVADCTIDHVGRSAAAGGVKWVAANSSAGTPTDFITTLWSRNQGYAREALVVLLEGSPAGVTLGALGDGLLVEAVTLATHLRTTQWNSEVERLADDRFFGPDGDMLHAICLEYELKIAPGAGEPSLAAVRRLVDRDHRRWRAGKPPVLGTAATLLEKIVSTGAFQDVSVQSWLVEVAGKANEYSFGKVRDAISAILTAGDVGTGLAMFRALAGLTDSARGNAVAAAIVDRRFVYEDDLIEFLGPELILANVGTWGETAIGFLAKLVEAKQVDGWPSRQRLERGMAEALGVAIEADSAFAPNYDEEPRITTLDRYEDGPIVRVAAIVSEAMKQAAALDDPRPFHDLANLAVRSRFASVVILPLLVLFDSARGANPHKDWHDAETVGLLSDDSVAALESLDEVRRLLRIGLPGTLGQTERGAVLRAIRESGVSDRMRIRELSDLQSWGLWTTEEAEQVAVAVAADDIDVPVDPRTEPLFTMGRSPPPKRTEARIGWPYPEDEPSVLLLQRSATESDVQVADGPQPTPLDQQLQSLRVVMNRTEALGEVWIGRALGWTHKAIQRLRHTIEKGDGEDHVQKLTSTTWREALDQNAPWWRSTVDAAITRLNAPLPESHAKKEMKTVRLSWTPDDPILNSLELIDEVLAINPDPPFGALQDRFIDTIVSKWKEWPRFTRASALSCLRPWYWCAFSRLRALLGETLKQESDPVVLRYAVDRLVLANPASEIPDFVRRATAGGHADALRTISHLLGDAVAQKLLPSPNGRVIELESYYRQCMAFEWPNAEPLSDFLYGALRGIVDCAKTANTEPDGTWPAWLNELDQIVARWPFNMLNTDRDERFPVHVLLGLFKNNASAEDHARLFVGLAGTFERILRAGDLPAFCALHHDLKGLLVGTYRFARGGRVRQGGLAMSAAVEEVLPALTKASVERVAAWKKEHKTTNDMGWRSGLDGRDSSELVKCCLDASLDRNRMLRSLIPLPDILADAGCLNVAAELRAYLRSS